jgi:hypothetical protein
MAAVPRKKESSGVATSANIARTRLVKRPLGILRAGSYPLRGSRPRQRLT